MDGVRRSCGSSTSGRASGVSSSVAVADRIGPGPALRCAAIRFSSRCIGQRRSTCPRWCRPPTNNCCCGTTTNSTRHHETRRYAAQRSAAPMQRTRTPLHLRLYSIYRIDRHLLTAHLFTGCTAMLPLHCSSLCSYGTHSLLAGQWTAAASTAGASSWLRLLRILARTRSDLEATLFAPEFVRFLVQHTAAAGAGDGASLLLAGECVRLLLNLCVINRALVHRALRVDAATSEAPEQKSNDATAGADADGNGGADGASPLRSLIGALGVVRCSRADREVRFHFLRVLLFVLVDSRLAKEGVAHAQLYQRLLRVMLEHSEGNRIGVDLADGDAGAAPTTSADADGEQYADASENRKVVMSALKVLTNLALDDALPSVRSVLTTPAAAPAPAAAAASAPASAATGAANSVSAASVESDAALYSAYLRRMAAILRVGVEIPDECKEDYAGDPAAAAIVAAAQAAAAQASAANAAAEAAAAANESAAPAPAPAAASADGSQQPRPSTPTSLAAPEASTSTAAAASASAAAPNLIAPAAAAAAAAARFPPFQRQQTCIVLGLLASESAADSRAPANSASLVQLQRDVSTVLMGADGGDAAMLALLEADGCRAFHSLVQLLHRDLVRLAGPPAAAAAARREAPTLLGPSLGALGRIVDASKVCRAHLKRCIFLELAPVPRTGADGRTPYRRSDATNYSMGAAGSLSEKCVDPDPLSLRQLLLSWIVTLDFNLKQAVSELLYRVCDDDCQCKCAHIRRTARRAHAACSAVQRSAAMQRHGLNAPEGKGRERKGVQAGSSRPVQAEAHHPSFLCLLCCH